MENDTNNQSLENSSENNGIREEHAATEVKKEDQEGEQQNNGFCETMEETAQKGNDAIADSFGLSKEDVLNQLSAANNVEQNVQVFAKRADKYGIEAILSMIPAIGDLGPAIISTCFLLYQGHKAGLELKDMLKILGYQTVDCVLGSIPILGNLIDFLYGSNVRSAKIFEKHVEKLVQLAKEKGASQEEINEIYKGGGEMLRHFDEHLRKKSKRQKKANEWIEKKKDELSEWKEKRKNRKKE